MDYRKRLLEKYASCVQGRTRAIPLAEADAWGEPFDAWFRGWLPANNAAAIVDVACGYGRLLRFFARRGYTNVLGVDISAEQVELARRIHPNVECANALDFLEQRPGAFDLVIGMDIIEHLRKDEALRFLDGVHGALRPGGRVILQTINGESPMRGADWHGDFTHETCFTVRTLGQLLGLCGFERIEPREQAPVPRGAASAVRAALWQVVRLRRQLLNLIETGSRGSGVCTRNLLISATKP